MRAHILLPQPLSRRGASAADRDDPEVVELDVDDVPEGDRRADDERGEGIADEVQVLGQAICTAKVPTPPEAPLTSTRQPGPTRAASPTA